MSLRSKWPPALAGGPIRNGRKRAHPAPFLYSRYSFLPCQNKNGAGRNRFGRHRTVAGPFQCNPAGLRPIGCFPSVGRLIRSLRPAPVSRWRHGCRTVGAQNCCGMLVATASQARTALNNSQLALRARIPSALNDKMSDAAQKSLNLTAYSTSSSW